MSGGARQELWSPRRRGPGRPLRRLPWADPAAAGPTELGYLALFGFFQMTVGLTLFVIGARLIPAAHTALIGALEAPLAPLWVWLAFDELPPSLVFVGAIVMVAVIGHILIENRRGDAAHRGIGVAAAPGAECP